MEIRRGSIFRGYYMLNPLLNSNEDQQKKVGVNIYKKENKILKKMNIINITITWVFVVSIHHGNAVLQIRRLFL